MTSLLVISYSMSLQQHSHQEQQRGFALSVLGELRRNFAPSKMISIHSIQTHQSIPTIYNTIYNRQYNLQLNAFRCWWPVCGEKCRESAVPVLFIVENQHFVLRGVCAPTTQQSGHIILGIFFVCELSALRPMILIRGMSTMCRSTSSTWSRGGWCGLSWAWANF